MKGFWGTVCHRQYLFLFQFRRLNDKGLKGFCLFLWCTIRTRLDVHARMSVKCYLYSAKLPY